MTTICGILPLRAGVALGYPFELAVRSLQRFCNHVVVSVDPTTADAEETVRRLWALNEDWGDTGRVEVISSSWDMTNHNGMNNNEISVQTDYLIEYVSAYCAQRDDWIYSLQADEIIHEDDASKLRELVERAAQEGLTGIEQERIYFYGDLETVRTDWTICMVRLFQRECWEPDRDGAMRFWPAHHPGNVTVAQDWSDAVTVPIYHYSRIGDPKLIAERIRGLDRMFHAPEKVTEGDLPAYDFVPRQLDTYVKDAPAELAPGVLQPWTGNHPAGVRDFYNKQLPEAGA